MAVLLSAWPAGPVGAAQLVPVCVSAHYHACGLLDRAGNWVVEPQYSAIHENGNAWTVERASGLSGLLSAEGKVQIAPAFDYIGPFVDGIAAATRPGPRDRLSGYIDLRGAWLIEPDFLYTAPFNGRTTLAWQGPTFEQRQLLLLRHDGSRQPLPQTEDVAATDGRFVVQRGSEQARECAGLDQNGQVLVRFAGECGLEIVAGAGWVRNEVAAERGATESQVLDRTGKVLYRVQGAEPWIGEANAEGIARYMTDGAREGLLDVRRGRVVLGAAPRSVYHIAEGRMSFATSAEGASRFGYLDYRGRVVIPARFSGVTAFAHGYAAVQFAPDASADRGRAAVIDPQGREVPGFMKLDPESIELDPWGDGPQSPVRRDVAKVISGNTIWYTTLQGTVIASLQTDPECGAQSLRNARGEIVWPRHPSASCTLRSGAALADTVDTALQAARLELRQHEASLERERAAIDAQGGGILNLLDPERPARRAALDAAPWKQGVEPVQLGNTVTLRLPEGHRYLAAPDVAALPPDALGGLALPSGLGLLEAPDGRWRALVGVVGSGQVRLDRPLQSNDALLELLHARRFGLFAPRANPLGGAMINLQWEIEPQIDLERRRLVYAFRYRDYRTAVVSRYLQVVKFGRSESVVAMIEFGGVLRMNDLESFQDEILTALEGVQFAPGQRHGDASAADAGDAASLESFVTGGPTAKETRFLEVLKEQESPFSWRNIRPHVGQVLGLLALALSAGLWGRKARPRPDV